MKRAVSADEARALETLAEQRFGISIPVLMENAGAALAKAALSMAQRGSRFLVLCGTGNNGGDGLVAARWLAKRGRTVQVELVGAQEKLSEGARRNWRALESVKLKPAPVADARRGDVVLDALFGTGLSRAPAGAAAEAIARIARWRAKGARVVSADLASGLPSDGGAPFQPCVEADVTVAFGALKLGQLSAGGARVSGDIRVENIGFPPEDVWPRSRTATYLLEESDAAAPLPVRPLDSNKGMYGHVLVVSGSPGKSGAASLCSRSVLHAGAGLCTIASRPDVVEGTLARTPELMGIPLPGKAALGRSDGKALEAALEKKSAWVVGPGIARGAQTAALLLGLVRKMPIPCVLDADALNAIAGKTDALKHARAPVVLTPHPGEMARLVGKDIATVQADRFGFARRLAKESGAIVVLKGARTVIAAPDGRCFVNPTGNPGMATGGTGDVLAGLCAGLLAQKLPALEAVCTAVYVHGLAGDLAAERRGQLGLLASDVIEGFSDVWLRWHR